MRFLPMMEVPLAHGPAVEQAFREFYNSGRSAHAIDGVLLAPLLNHLTQYRVAYTLRFVPDRGYFIERGVDPEQLWAIHGTRAGAPPLQPLSATPTPDIPSSAAPMSLISVIQARIDATKGTSLAPTFLRLDHEQLGLLRPYAHREGLSEFVMGLPVELIGSPSDEARRDRGEVGFAIPTEAIASKE